MITITNDYNKDMVWLEIDGDGYQGFDLDHIDELCEVLSIARQKILHNTKKETIEELVRM